MTGTTATAVLLMAHGSRRQEANADLDELAAKLRASGEYLVVQPSYLELASPSISAGGAMCVAAGAGRVLMLPYFLSAGTHVSRDLETARRELSEKFREVEFLLCPPLGLHPLMVEIVRSRLREGGEAVRDANVSQIHRSPQSE